MEASGIVSSAEDDKSHNDCFLSSEISEVLYQATKIGVTYLTEEEPGAQLSQESCSKRPS